jgi:hypothetical protein
VGAITAAARLSAIAAFVLATRPGPAAATPNGFPGSTKTARPTSKAADTPPPADVKLAIQTPTTRGPWTLRVVNDGDVPVRIVADARLLFFDVTPRGARKSRRCELPSDMRPDDDLERPLVLPPKRAYAETFEPRLYCFDADSLSPGAIVVAHLGWTGRAARPPFELSAIDGVKPEIAPRKSIDAPPIALPDEPTPAAIPPAAPGSDTPRLSLRSPRAMDAESASQIEIPVTLRNEGGHSVVVRFRPEMLAFDVVGPAGAAHCTWPMLPAAAMRELFTTLPPGGTTSLSVLLTAYCAGNALDPAGLFVVRPRLDTRRGSGADIGLRTFDGEVVAAAPTVVRLHRSQTRDGLVRPKLEPQ